jgi:hypothetical protein
MLRTEQNELLTRTAPGTSTGAMFRRYWIPALLAEELPENDGAPVRMQATHRVRSASVVLSASEPFQEAARDALLARPGVAPVSV